MTQIDLSNFLKEDWDKFTNSRSRSSAGGLPFHIGPDPAFNKGSIEVKYHELAGDAQLVLLVRVTAPDWFHLDSGQLTIHAQGRNFVLQPGEYHNEFHYSKTTDAGYEITPSYTEEWASYPISIEDFYAICCAPSIDCRLTGSTYKHEFSVTPEQLLLFRQFYHLVFNAGAFQGCLATKAQVDTPELMAHISRLNAEASSEIASGYLILILLLMGIVGVVGFVIYAAVS